MDQAAQLVKARDGDPSALEGIDIHFVVQEHELHLKVTQSRNVRRGQDNTQVLGGAAEYFPKLGDRNQPPQMALNFCLGFDLFSGKTNTWTWAVTETVGIKAPIPQASLNPNLGGPLYERVRAQQALGVEPKQRSLLSRVKSLVGLA